MRTAKSSLTRLKKNIDKVFPSAPDLMGFDGVNKIMLLDSLEESYGLLEGLVDKKETFDVIFMKRKISDLTKSCNDYLNDNLKDIGKEKKFNAFLNDISEIRSVIKRTYLLVIEESLRDEASLHNLRAELASYRESLDEYIDYKESIDEAYGLIITLKKDLEQYSAEYSNSSEHVSEVISRIDEALSEVERNQKQVTSEKEDILTTKSQILRNKVAFNGNVKRYEELLSNLQQQEAKINVQFESVEKISTSLSGQQKAIQDIIDDANRASMAGSFLKRKNELDKPIKWSGRIMNAALVITAGISFALLFNSGLLEAKFDYISFLTKIPIVAPFIWIAWSNSQRNNYLIRIQEDYAFKYASAMAFEGYKKQVQEADEDLQHRLLTLAIENMGSNPIRLFEKPVKNSPATDVFQSVTDIAKSLKPQETK
ncbi:TPA: hypothetical protein I7297_12415 [Vibrio parahaemolyticus]|nr:hypothetical protein [Vibrio parahaemolyticus]